MVKKGLKEFIVLYDIAGEMGWLALDLAQNLLFRFELAKDKNVQEEDVRLAYELDGHNLMEAIHKLANVLGYTRENYIDNADKRRGRGNCNIYVAGQGSIFCKAEDLFKEI